METKRFNVLIYKEDAELINRWTLQYPNIETGGDLFGLWQNESEVVVQLAIGAGENCRRTTTAFFQDERYLGNVGSYLTSTEGLCNIGEWHSHHSLNLPEPSSGDKQTIWRHLPEYKLDRFLLFIATISQENGLPGIHSFMFTSPENAYRHGEMFPTTFKILPGPNPYRIQKEVMEKLSQGAEVGTAVDCGGFEMNKKRSKKEKKRRKKEEEEKKNRENKKMKDEEKAKKKEEKAKKKEEKAKKKEEKAKKKEEKAKKKEGENKKKEEKNKKDEGKGKGKGNYNKLNNHVAPKTEIPPSSYLTYV